MRRYETPKRNRFDIQGINENSQLMYKNGFEPRTPGNGHSALELKASGWRTKEQMDKAEQKKARRKLK